MRVPEVIGCRRVERLRAGAPRPGSRQEGYRQHDDHDERTALRPPAAVAEARRAARAFLEALGQPATGREQAGTVVLGVSEPVTNALRHGGGLYALRLAAHPNCIEVAVEDPSPPTPRMRASDLVDGTGGFGWYMVNGPSLAPVVPPGPEGGKTVRVLLPR
ncbi:ATP-binding protein [Streptomyces virginiae]|uniref:ATP-binding protein n=1 Tax=Streptomyces virginiae TaxID=1961 RepID=UPI0036EF03EA